MNKRRVEMDARQQFSGRIEEACRRYGLGRNSMRQVAEDAGAVIRVGKVLLLNFRKLDTYFDLLSGEDGD